jgi:hypothetical protein
MGAFTQWFEEYRAKMSTSGQNPAAEHETVMDIVQRVMNQYDTIALWNEGRL